MEITPQPGIEEETQQADARRGQITTRFGTMIDTRVVIILLPNWNQLVGSDIGRSCAIVIRMCAKIQRALM